MRFNPSSMLRQTKEGDRQVEALEAGGVVTGVWVLAGLLVPRSVVTGPRLVWCSRRLSPAASELDGGGRAHV